MFRILILSIGLIFVQACSDKPSPVVTRNSFLPVDSLWGKPPESVSRAETFTPIEPKPNQLTYYGIVALSDSLRFDAVLTYDFQNDYFNQFTLSLEPLHTEEKNFPLAIETVFQTISHFYSARPKRALNWKSELYRHDKAKFARAVQLGHVSLEADWKKKPFEIMAFTTSWSVGRVVIIVTVKNLEFAPIPLH